MWMNSKVPAGAFRPEALLVHREWIERAARALVHGETEAEDLSQQAWLKVLQHPPPSTPERPRGWFRSVLRFTALDRARAERRRRRHETAASNREAVESTPESVLARAESLDRVAHAVFALEEPYRTAVLLRYFEGLDPRAIAARQGVPLETVRTRLKRALALLREGLEERSGGERGAWALALVPLLREAPATSTATVAGPGAALAAGGVLMGKKTVALLLVALLAGGAWWGLRTVEPLEVGSALPGTGGGPVPQVPSLPISAPPSPPPTAPPPSRPAPAATGQVTDREGHPIPGARVLSFPDDLPVPLDPASVRGEQGPGRVSMADADGRFSVTLAGTSPLFSIRAEAEGYGPTWASGVRPGSDVALTLDGPGTIVGSVTDTRGDPVPGAVVRVATLVDLTRTARETTTGADGAYRLTGVPTAPGLYSLEVSAPGLATALRVLPETPRPGEEIRYDVILARWCVLRGRVLDGRTNEPVPGARVVLCATACTGGGGWTSSTGSGGRRTDNPDAWKALGEATTGAGGSYRIDRLLPGGMNPWLSVYAGALKDGWTTQLLQVTLTNAGEEAELDLRLWPAATIEGRVFEGEQPASGVTVSASIAGTETASWFPSMYGEVPLWWSTTDGEGRYRLQGVPVPGQGPATAEVRAYSRSMMFQVGGKAEPAARAEIEVLAAKTTSVPDLVMPAFRPAAVDVVVVDREGRPIGGAEFVAPGCPTNPRTDASGRARLLWPPGDSPSPARPVIVRARGFGPEAVAVVPDEADPPVVRVVLGRGHTLKGRVLGAGPEHNDRVLVQVANGHLAPEEAFRRAMESSGGTATIPSFPPLRVYASLAPDKDGRFRVEDLPDGPWYLRAVAYLPEDPAEGLPSRTRESPLVTAGPESGEVVIEIPADPTPK